MLANRFATLAATDRNLRLKLARMAGSYARILSLHAPSLLRLGRAQFS